MLLHLISMQDIRPLSHNNALMTFIDLQGSSRTKMDLKGPSRTFEDSWVPIISRGSTIGSDILSALGLVYEDLV